MACDQCSHPVRPNLLERTAQVSFEFLPPRISLLSDVLYLLAQKKFLKYRNPIRAEYRGTNGFSRFGFNQLYPLAPEND